MAVKMASEGKYWGDVVRTQCNIINGTYQVRPAMSLCRNWGNDGSGVNCKVDKSIAQQPISTATVYEEPSDWEPYYSKEIAKATFRLTWPKNPILFLGKMLITVLLCLKFRITHR